MLGRGRLRRLPAPRPGDSTSTRRRTRRAPAARRRGLRASRTPPDRIVAGSQAGRQPRPLPALRPCWRWRCIRQGGTGRRRRTALHGPPARGGAGGSASLRHRGREFEARRGRRPPSRAGDHPGAAGVGRLGAGVLRSASFLPPSRPGRGRGAACATETPGEGAPGPCTTERYAGEPFVELGYEPPGVRDVRDTNLSRVHVSLDDAGRGRLRRDSTTSGRGGRSGGPESEPDAGAVGDAGSYVSLTVGAGARRVEELDPAGLAPEFRPGVAGLKGGAPPTSACSSATRPSRFAPLPTRNAAAGFRIAPCTPSREPPRRRFASEQCGADLGRVADEQAQVGGAAALQPAGDARRPEFRRQPSRVELLDPGGRPSPTVSGRTVTGAPPSPRSPSIRFRFWIAWPAAPFQRLSIAAKTIARPVSSSTATWIAAEVACRARRARPAAGRRPRRTARRRIAPRTGDRSSSASRSRDVVT